MIILALVGLNCDCFFLSSLESSCMYQFLLIIHHKYSLLSKFYRTLVLLWSRCSPKAKRICGFHFKNSISIPALHWLLSFYSNLFWKVFISLLKRSWFYVASSVVEQELKLPTEYEMCSNVIKNLPAKR